MVATKIATCCYCGTKATLVLGGLETHELTCSNCGAPLRSLKMLRKDSMAGRAAPHGPRKAFGPKPVRKSHGYRDDPRKKKKKPKSLRRKMLSGLWDVVEDVVDEIFD